MMKILEGTPASRMMELINSMINDQHIDLLLILLLLQVCRTKNFFSSLPILCLLPHTSLVVGLVVGPLAVLQQQQGMMIDDDAAAASSSRPPFFVFFISHQ